LFGDRVWWSIWIGQNTNAAVFPTSEWCFAIAIPREQRRALNGQGLVPAFSGQLREIRFCGLLVRMLFKRKKGSAEAKPVDPHHKD